MSRARAVAWLAVLCAASAFGCARAPASSLLLCHNANCASPGTVERDDDLGALDASLALRLDGRPPFDGVELDTVWDAGAGRCLFAHGAGTPAPLLSEATDRIATLLAGEAPASWNGARFYLKIELKPDVAADGRAHSQAEAEAHADCVLDRLAEVERAAATRGRAVTALLDASDPTLLVTLTQRPRWPGKRAGGGVRDPPGGRLRHERAGGVRARRAHGALGGHRPGDA